MSINTHVVGNRHLTYGRLIPVGKLLLSFVRLDLKNNSTDFYTLYTNKKRD